MKPVKPFHSRSQVLKTFVLLSLAVAPRFVLPVLGQQAQKKENKKKKNCPQNKKREYSTVFRTKIFEYKKKGDF